mmetsp:Transcript_29958/g.85640  ORF Transcript_29958/g.85640 Transcript_29958/m.85640 type:complete len:235 (+) Transcript_29958:1894-2598(+)
MTCFESLKAPSRSNGGDSMYILPSSAETTFLATSVSRFSFRDLITSICWNADSFPAKSDGKGRDGMSSAVQKEDHPLPPPAMASRRPEKAVSPDASVNRCSTLSFAHAAGLTHLGTCGSSWSSVSVPFPASWLRRKNSHSEGVMALLPRNAECVPFRRIWAEIRNANRSLWSSKRPRQIFRKMNLVKSSIRMAILLLTSSSFSDSLRRSWNNVTKNSRLYWYMGSMLARSATTK